MENGIQPVMNMNPSHVNSDGLGFGGNSGLWLFAILALMWGGNGLLGNRGFSNSIGYENLATSNEVQRGFDNQNAMANQREILTAVTNGTAQSVAATNQTFHDTLAALGDKYNEITRDIGNVQVAQAQALANQNQCCCNTLRAIDGVNYNNAINTATITANATAQTQKILDVLTANKIETLQNRINQLELQTAVAGVVRYPNSMSYNAGTSPFCNNSCGCGFGNI